MAGPLAEITDLIERLGRDLTDGEVIRSAAVLRDASAAFRRAAGNQIISQETSTISVAPYGGRIRLPQYPVTAISSVVNTASQAVTFVWYLGWYEVVVDSSALLNSWEIEPFRYSTPTVPVTVTYTHGYDPVPDDVIGVVCSLATRALGQTPDAGGIVQEALGGYSYSVGSAAAQGGFGMLDSERAIAESYRRPAAPISML